MFSRNETISNRQLYRNYTIGFVSLSALLAPLFMGRENGMSLVIALLLLGLVLVMSSQSAAPKSLFVKILCYVHYWVLGTLIAHMTGFLIQEYLLNDTSLWLILGWFYLFCFYNTYKGLECRIRVSEILFPFFLFLLVLLSLLMLGEVEVKRLSELRFAIGTTQISGGYQMFAWLSAMLSLWHLQGVAKGNRSFGKTVWVIWTFGSAAAVLWALFSYCVYGDSGHTGLIFPLASAMTLAHLPGNVIGRMDALFVFAWVIGLFLLCCSLFAPLSAKEPDRRSRYVLLALLLASLAVVVQEECMEWCLNILYYISTPVQLLILIGYWLRNNGRKGVVSTGILILALFLGGCGNQELEERSMVSAIGVDEGTEKTFSMTFSFGVSTKGKPKEPFETECDSLSEAEALYYDSGQKDMDFNHLKNFYFSEGLMGSEHLPKLLEEIQGSSDYSRGTSVYITPGSPAEDAKKEDQPKEGTPIHRLLNAWYNTESCELSRVNEEGMYKGTYLWR